MTQENKVFVNNKLMRCGYTTGTCATAASKAAAKMLFSRVPLTTVKITVPRGQTLTLEIECITIENESVTCAVRKDGGDDIDATHGTLIFSTVLLRDDGKIVIDGGKGVGRITRKGLDQPVGNAAINHVPRNMIYEALESVGKENDHNSGFTAIIEVPEGEEIAKRTFNPNLGIIGGISILGTSGIVEPMSEVALIETIRTEMKMHVAEGAQYLIVVPGNYGKDFLEEMDFIGKDSAIKCSNFVGEALDCALELGVKGLLLVGNLGKLVKIAGGIMNTHSRNADARMEILAANSILAGADINSVKEILGCVTTDDALDVINEAGLMKSTMDLIAEKIQNSMEHRTGGKMLVGTVVFSSKYGKLCESANVTDLRERLRQ